MDLLNKLKSMLGEPAEPEIKVEDTTETKSENPCDCENGTCNCENKTDCNCDCADGNCENCKKETKDE